MMKTTIVILIAIAMSACSSIKSIERPQTGAESVNGLTYFMPKKDFLVTITVSGNNITKITLGTTSSYPDLSEQYVLRYGGNLFGKNTLEVGISESGLLTSAKSTTVSKVTEAFKNLAATAGQFVPFVQLKAAGGDSCTADGDHTFMYEGEGSHQVCGIDITIVRLDSHADNVKPHSKAVGEEYSGVFYRQNIPYRITASGKGLHVASVVFSPSESKTHFLPVSRTFFSNNEADFEFVEGIPTKYKQDTDGELVALFKLPADVIAAYFTAIGSVFDSFKTTNEKEAQAMTESLKLELAKKKYDACISAIKAGDNALIKELGCP